MSLRSVAAAERAAAGAVCSSLHRAYRDLRFYPPEHPMALRSIETLISAVSGFTCDHGALVLEVREDALVFEGEPVYSHEAGRDNLAFLMFRDGIRSLSIFHGVSAAEIETLVDCLAHADDLAAVEHDLVTALWEKDFAHIDYRVVDPFLGGEILREGMVDALKETILRRLEDTIASPHAGGDASAWRDLRNVTPDLIDPGALALSKQDLERGELVVQSLSDVIRDYTEVLVEIAAAGKAGVDPGTVGPDDGADEGPDAVASALTSAASTLLDEGDIDGAATLFERLSRLEDPTSAGTGTAGEVIGRALTADHLRLLLRPGGGDEVGRWSERPDALLSAARPWIVEPLLEILTETDDRSVRKYILGLLGAEDGIPWRYLEPLLRDPRWYVVRNAVQLAASMSHIEFTEHGRRLLEHPDVRVRRETLRALEKIGGQTAARAMARALVDEDSSMRTIAARGVARHGGREHEPTLLSRIEDREFVLQPTEEVQAFLEAYATLAQERAVPLLDRLWRKRFFSGRPVTFRAATVQSLGKVKHSSARSILREAAGSGEIPIRTAARLALQMQVGSSAEGGGD